MNALDEWEAESTYFLKEKIFKDGARYYGQHKKLICEFSDRILALIDLVKKKDEALNFYCGPDPTKKWDGERWPNRLLRDDFGNMAREALELTENLK